jgi:hypothetical protein
MFVGDGRGKLSTGTLFLSALRRQSMKFLIERTSHIEMGSHEPPAPGAVRSQDGKAWEIDFASLEELTEMIITLDEPLILSRRQGRKGLVAVEIYDDMRESTL